MSMDAKELDEIVRELRNSRCEEYPTPRGCDASYLCVCFLHDKAAAAQEKALLYDLDMAGIDARAKEAVELVQLRADLASARERIAKLEAERDALKLEAQIHAQEAKTANATIAEIYQACTGASGEPGNWRGAEPVRKVVDERDSLKRHAEAMWGQLAFYSSANTALIAYRRDHPKEEA